MPRDESLALSEKEMEAVRRIAKVEGISVEEAVTKLVQASLARRVRRRTGRGPAKVYGMRRR